jgi:hypothetical protein
LAIFSTCTLSSGISYALKDSSRGWVPRYISQKHCRRYD